MGHNHQIGILFMDFCVTLNDLDIKPCVGETDLSYTSARESTILFMIFYVIREVTFLHYGQAKCDLCRPRVRPGCKNVTRLKDLLERRSFLKRRKSRTRSSICILRQVYATCEIIRSVQLRNGGRHFALLHDGGEHWHHNFVIAPSP